VPLQPNVMDTILVYALAAAVLGGLDSPLGAVVAAWLIGVVETVAGANIDVIGSDLRIAVPLVLLALILLALLLLVRPQGRLAAGRARRRRHPQPARCAAGGGVLRARPQRDGQHQPRAVVPGQRDLPNRGAG
jgi:hypothetical protein